jgi:hypothetical protein
MQLKPLYRLRFTYPEEWSVNITGPNGTESEWFFIAEGRCEGRIAGRFRGANHPHRRTDATFMPNFQGVIETDDGAVIMVDLRGYGRAYPVGRRQIVGSSTHISEHKDYAWLNDVVCVLTGEVRTRPGQSTELVVDMAELVWEPIAE